MSEDVWYPVSPNDVFPEEFATFLLTDPGVRADFISAHSDLLDAGWWRAQQRKLATGELPEVLSYPDSLRFGTFEKVAGADAGQAAIAARGLAG